MSKEEITNVINKLNNPKNFNYYTNYGYAISLLISDADTIIEYIEELQQRNDKALKYTHEMLGFLENCVGGNEQEIQHCIKIFNKYLEILRGNDV